MEAFRDPGGIDRAIGFGGLALAIVALASTTQRIEVAGDPEILPAVTGLVMVAWVLVTTQRHRRVYPGRRGRGWLTAGWIVLGANLVWAVVQAADTATFDEGLWSGITALASGPPILIVLVPLVLCSVGILRDCSDTESTRAAP